MLAELHLSHGPVSAAEVRVRARLVGDEPLAGELRGVLVGPRCAHTRTLEARLPFRAARSSPHELTAEAVLPDPCCWSGERPFLYELDLEWRAHGQTLAAWRQPYGIRNLTVSKRSLFLDGKRWTARCVAQRVSGPRQGLPLADWRAAGAVLLTNAPEPDLLEQASREGVMVFSLYRESLEQAALRQRLLQWSAWPALALVALPLFAPVDNDLRQAAPNLILAAEHVPGIAPPSWAQVVLARNDALDHFEIYAKTCRQAWLASRPDRETETISAARDACDRLQADLAPLGQFAGYVV